MFVKLKKLIIISSILALASTKRNLNICYMQKKLTR